MEIVGRTYIYIYKVIFSPFFFYFSPTPRSLAATPTTTHPRQDKGDETRCSDGVYERRIYILTPPVNLGRYLLHAYKRERAYEYSFSAAICHRYNIILDVVCR